MGGGSTTSLCAELYAAAHLSGGHVDMTSSEATAYVLRYGLLALPVVPDARTEPSITLDTEPVMRGILLSHGDSLARDNNIDGDPIIRCWQGRSNLA